MYKSCSRCGKIHDTKYKCNVGKVYSGGKERELRNTHAWHKKSEQVKKKASYLCEICKDKGRYVYDNLETHHIEKVKDNEARLLDELNLLCLCVDCHKLADAGKIDKEYQFRLARQREEKY